MKAGRKFGDRLRTAGARPHAREVPVFRGVEDVLALAAAHAPVTGDCDCSVGFDVEPRRRLGTVNLVGTGDEKRPAHRGTVLKLDQPRFKVVGTFTRAASSNSAQYHRSSSRVPDSIVGTRAARLERQAEGSGVNCRDQLLALLLPPPDRPRPPRDRRRRGLPSVPPLSVAAAASSTPATLARRGTLGRTTRRAFA